jgi:RHS repeat-associated protein
VYSDGQNTKVTGYEYGADGLRRRSIDKIDPGDSSTWVYNDYILDGQNVVQEMVDGDLAATYMTGGRGIEFRKDASDGAIHWYVYDGLGSLLSEVSEPGEGLSISITPAPRTDVYGNQIGDDTGVGKQRFCGSLGHTTEPDTGGLIYMRARWMDPVTGTFVSEDPAKDGANWYAYCEGNPVTCVDYSGLEFTYGETMEASEAGAEMDGEGGAAYGVQDFTRDLTRVWKKWQSQLRERFGSQKEWEKAFERFKGRLNPRLRGHKLDIDNNTGDVYKIVNDTYEIVMNILDEYN